MWSQRKSQNQRKPAPAATKQNTEGLRKNENGYYYSVAIPVYAEKRVSIKSSDQSATSIEYDEFLELFDEKDYDKIIPYTPEYTYGFQVDDINRNIHEFHDNVVNSQQLNLKKQISNYVLNKYNASLLPCK